MHEPLQLSLNGIDETGWPILLEAVKAVIKRVGHERAAAAMDESVPYLHHCLAERHRHVLKLRHIVPLLALDAEGVILKTLGRLLGFEIVPIPPIDPEEELAALKDVIAQNFSLEVRLVLLAQAKELAGKTASVAAKKGSKR
jgi:hypothetical protein